MNSYEEIYYTEISFNKFKCIIINVKEKTFKEVIIEENQLDDDAIIMSPSVLDALIIGLSKEFKKQ